MLSEQGEEKELSLILKLLAVQRVSHGLSGIKVGEQERHILIRADRAECGFCGTGIDNAVAAGLDDPAFCGRDLFDGIAEILGVFETDIRKHGDFGSIDRVCAVKRAAHADLEYDDVALHLVEIFHSYGGHELELARMILHHIGKNPDLRGDRSECLIGDITAVDFYALVEAYQIGRGIKPCAVTRLAKDRIEDRAGAALAVASGNMYEFQLFLGIAQSREQSAGTVETESRGAPGIVFYISDRFLCIHFEATSGSSEAVLSFLSGRVCAAANLSPPFLLMAVSSG